MALSLNPAPAPAALRAIADANATWPSRSKISDGILGDAAHLARCTKEGRCEGHVLGNAVDITHDPANGVDGRTLAELALNDNRTAYVISNGQIKSRKGPFAGQDWRAYSGNPHTKHVHVSLDPNMRNEAGPWPWAPSIVPVRNSTLTIVAMTGGITALAYYLGRLIFKW